MVPVAAFLGTIIKGMEWEEEEYQTVESKDDWSEKIPMRGIDGMKKKRIKREEKEEELGNRGKEPNEGREATKREQDQNRYIKRNSWIWKKGRWQKSWRKGSICKRQLWNNPTCWDMIGRYRSIQVNNF